jgi:L-histidine Nalpha-methyltransferase
VVVPSHKILTPDFALLPPQRDPSFAHDVLAGLTRRHKSLPSKYFYDAEGSRLFDRITRLEEYYLTRVELEILTTHAGDVSAALGSGPFNLIELGAGDGPKTDVLIRRFLEDDLEFQYVPIDISGSAIDGLTRTLRRRFPGLKVNGIVGDYLDSNVWRDLDPLTPSLVLFLGSNIGNMDPLESRVFLGTVRAHLHDGDLVLIGFDLKKDLSILLPAYSDSEGVTADFNLNLLRRINRELGANFDPSRFRHYASWSPALSAMESHLVSREYQVIDIAALGRSFTFEPLEAIHTEYSYKYLDHDVMRIASENGFSVVRPFHDPRHWFTDSLWRAVEFDL